MEGAINGLPALAFSLDSRRENSQPHFADAAAVAAEIVRMVQHNPLPKDILLNVNIPDLPREEMGGPLITRQGLRIYRDALVRRADPRGVPYYWIGGEAPTGLAEEGTDIGALASGLVSITPIQLDLTAQQSLAALQKWNWFQLGPQA
jgi:5'-nucleotidase